MKKFGKSLLSSLAVLAFWLAVWYFAAFRVDRALILPTPAAVSAKLFELGTTADFWRSVLYSILRVSLGILIAVATGILLALLTSRYAFLHRLFSPLITVIKATPVASFIILVLLWLGSSILPVFIAALIVLPLIWSAISDGITALDKELLEVCRVYRFSLSKRLRLFYLPSILPYFLSAIKNSIGMAWKAGVAAEVLAVSPVSIGKELSDAKIYLETEELFAWTLVVILLSLAVEYFVTKLLGRVGYYYVRRKRNAEGQ